MSFTTIMHNRNPYHIPPDFTELSESYDRLKPYLVSDPSSGRTTIDFRDEEAQRRLTEAIMHRDFGVTLYIPPTRLCPPVPNRLNYVLWIQDIVMAHEDVLGLHLRTRPIRGIDIGTGSTAIYPFLLCKLEPTWEIVATEIDGESYVFARGNITQNDMQSRIDLRKASSSPESLIFFPLQDNHKNDTSNFEFTMCNPPFYGSANEIAKSAEGKELPPNAVCTGAEIEMIYPNGGEEGFVRRMVEESERFRTKCKWYTSMLGKMSSVTSITETLRQRSISNYAITEFVQGQTRRWAIAWSFTDTRLPDVVSRIPSISPKHPLHSCMPSRNTFIYPFPGYAAQSILARLADTLQSINGVSCTEIHSTSSDNKLNLFFLEARENTWSRSARRSQANSRQAAVSDGTAHLTTAVSNPALTCSCRVIINHNLQDQGEAVHAVEVQWMFGKDRALFESFAGHVGRKVGSALRSDGKV